MLRYFADILAPDGAVVHSDREPVRARSTSRRARKTTTTSRSTGSRGTHGRTRHKTFGYNELEEPALGAFRQISSSISPIRITRCPRASSLRRPSAGSISAEMIGRLYRPRLSRRPGRRHSTSVSALDGVGEERRAAPIPQFVPGGGHQGPWEPRSGSTPGNPFQRLSEEKEFQMVTKTIESQGDRKYGSGSVRTAPRLRPCRIGERSGGETSDSCRFVRNRSRCRCSSGRSGRE